MIWWIKWELPNSLLCFKAICKEWKMCCITVTVGIISVLKITNQEPVSHNFVQGKSFLTGMAKALSSCVAVKKSSLAVSVTFVSWWVNEGLKDISNLIITPADNKKNDWLLKFNVQSTPKIIPGQKWRSACTYQFHFLGLDQLTVARQTKITVDKRSLTSCMWVLFCQEIPTLYLNSILSPLCVDTHAASLTSKLFHSHLTAHSFTLKSSSSKVEEL